MSKPTLTSILYLALMLYPLAHSSAESCDAAGLRAFQATDTDGDGVIIPLEYLQGSGRALSLLNERKTTLSGDDVRFDVNQNGILDPLDYYYLGQVLTNKSCELAAKAAIAEVPVAANLSLDAYFNISGNYRTGFLKATLAQSRPVTFKILSSAGKGKVELVNSGTGEFRYYPGSGSTGLDSFTYHAMANGKVSAPATVNLRIIIPYHCADLNRLPEIPVTSCLRSLSVQTRAADKTYLGTLYRMGISLEALKVSEVRHEVNGLGNWQIVSDQKLDRFLFACDKPEVCSIRYVGGTPYIVGGSQDGYARLMVRSKTNADFYTSIKVYNLRYYGSFPAGAIFPTRAF